MGAFIFLNRGYGSIWLMGAVLIVNAVGVEALIWVIGLWRKVEGIKLLPFFRAFILSCSEGVSSPFEEEISNLGQERDLSVDTLILKGESGEPIGAFVVPYIHPGPPLGTWGVALSPRSWRRAQGTISDARPWSHTGFRPTGWT
jgi:predicted neutral ceramidase superfamily lipid hydrolase